MKRHDRRRLDQLESQAAALPDPLDAMTEEELHAEIDRLHVEHDKACIEEGLPLLPFKQRPFKPMDQMTPEEFEADLRETEAAMRWLDAELAKAE